MPGLEITISIGSLVLAASTLLSWLKFRAQTEIQLKVHTEYFDNLNKRLKLHEEHMEIRIEKINERFDKMNERVNDTIFELKRITRNSIK